MRYLWLTALLALASCAPVTQSVAPPEPPLEAPAWAGEGGDPGRASVAAGPVPRTWALQRLQHLKEKPGYEPEEYAAPLVVAGVAYLGHSGRRFEAIRVTDGRSLWSLPVGGRVYGTAAYADGLLVFGHDGGEVLAVRVDGSVVWRFPTTYPVVASPLAVGGKVLVAVADQNLYCLEAATGRPLWQYGRRRPHRNALWRSQGLCYGDGRVYAGFSDGTVVALDIEDGRVDWRVELAPGGLFGDVAAGPSFRDGSVYAGVFRGPTARLDARTGEVLWRSDLEAVSGFAVGESLVYVGTAGGSVAALSREDGTKAWETALDGGVPTPPVLVAGHAVVVGASEGSLYALDDATGEVLGRYAPGPGLHAQPLVLEGAILILSDGGALHLVH